MADSQVEFDITDDHVEVCEKYLSPERLAGYYFLARGNRKVGILLYERNTELSEALYGVIQGFEVTLRNAIHNLMSDDMGTTSWWEKVELQGSETVAIDKAKQSIARDGEVVTTSRIVGEVNLAFWVRLFSSAYDKTIWSGHIKRLFPAGMKRTAIHSRLQDLKTLRNRIAHHQRIIGGKRDLPQDYANLIETISWLSPEMAVWVSKTNCFLERAEKKIRKLRKPEVKALQPVTSKD